MNCRNHALTNLPITQFLQYQRYSVSLTHLLQHLPQAHRQVDMNLKKAWVMHLMFGEWRVYGDPHPLLHQKALAQKSKCLLSSHDHFFFTFHNSFNVNDTFETDSNYLFIVKYTVYCLWYLFYEYRYLNIIIIVEYLLRIYPSFDLQNSFVCCWSWFLNSNELTKRTLQRNCLECFLYFL